MRGGQVEGRPGNATAELLAGWLTARCGTAFEVVKSDRSPGPSGVDTVVLAGCNFPNCPRATLFDASQRDYRVVVVEDATSRVTPERLADTVALGVHALTTETVIRHIRQVEPARHPCARSAKRL